MNHHHSMFQKIYVGHYALKQGTVQTQKNCPIEKKDLKDGTLINQHIK